MSITTREGDRGWTDLLFGGRVRKDDLRMHAVGALDELNSCLGLAKCSVKRREIRRVVEQCQHDLFILSSEIVTLPKNLARLECRVDEARIAWIEETLAQWEKSVKLRGCCFLIPGENAPSALFDLSRSIARRAERCAVTLQRRGGVPNERVMIYLNRLSDLLYLLARATEKTRTEFVARPADRKAPLQKRSAHR